MARFLSDKALMKHFGLSQRELDEFRLLNDFPKRDLIANKKTDVVAVNRYFDSRAGLAPAPPRKLAEDGAENFGS